MNKLNPLYIVSAVLLLTYLSIGCSPTYQSTRAYVPQHNKAKQLQVEVDESQADVSYSITDQISVNAGGVYLTSQTEVTQTSNGVEETNTETSTLMGGHIGVGYFKAFGASKKNVFSFNVGSAFQSWDYNQTNPSGPIPTKGETFTSFESSIINPYAQVGYSYGSQLSNIVLALRYEKPMFDFQNVLPTGLRDLTDPALVDIIIQGKFKITGPISFFTQYISRTNLDDDPNITGDYPPFEISTWNLYIGLSYSIGFEETKKEVVKGSTDATETKKAETSPEKKAEASPEKNPEQSSEKK